MFRNRPTHVGELNFDKGKSNEIYVEKIVFSISSAGIYEPHTKKIKNRVCFYILHHTPKLNQNRSLAMCFLVEGRLRKISVTMGKAKMF